MAEQVLGGAGKQYTVILEYDEVVAIRIAIEERKTNLLKLKKKLVESGLESAGEEIEGHVIVLQKVLVALGETEEDMFTQAAQKAKEAAESARVNDLI
jgi:hypothetical protein